MDGSHYRDRVRIRVCGLLVRNSSLLLVNMKSPVTGTDVWLPPGGGLEFGESMEACLKREFREETGLLVESDSLVHINQLIEPPYHAVEFYFSVEKRGGELKKGDDPEHQPGNQLIREVRFIPFSEFGSHDIHPDYVREEFPARYTGENREGFTPSV